MRTLDRRARLSADRLAVLCGRDLGNGFYCEEVLARIDEYPEGPRDAPVVTRHIIMETDWRRWPYPPREPDRLRRTGWERRRRGYAPTREGWLQGLGSGPRVRAMKYFGFDLPAECPRCHLLNILDPGRLDVTAMRRGR